MAKTLVIVESPTKAKTISKFLGSEYAVMSSFGHVRDLPKSKTGIDIEHDFEPEYVIPEKAKPHADALAKAAQNSKTVILATDEDREGEAIAWHLAHIMDIPTEETHRITFHEITESALKEAIDNPRMLDMRLVDAQQARRVLDRLVGYELSPFLWKKVYRGLSAGRVQSAAVRLIVEREREIRAFDAKEYWSIHGIFSADKNIVESELTQYDGNKFEKFSCTSEPDANDILIALKKSSFAISSSNKKTKKRYAPAPFITSSLQQAASSKFGYSPKQTMRIAQQLYEGVRIGSEGSVGLITYMRTDSVNLSNKFISETQAYVGKELGEKYVTGGTRYKGKSKNAQEAHEAIRPTSVFRTPVAMKKHLDARQYKVYELIWARAVGSQLPPAEFDHTTMLISDSTEKHIFKATGSVRIFDGWQRVYPEQRTDSELPPIPAGTSAETVDIKGEQHFTEPPARYSEATLVKALEELGIGRPSTYAPTIATIIDRAYVEKQEDKKLHPTDVAETVTDVLVAHFPEVIDYAFTARMEDDLDAVSRGERQWVQTIREFYTPFKKNLEEKYDSVDKKSITEEATDKECPTCGKPMVIKLGRFGKFYACSDYPDCKTTVPLEDERQEPQKHEDPCEKCGGDMVLKRGRFGPFYGCANYPDCKNIRKIEKKTGIACPECKQGELVYRKSGKTKRGFYGCNRYPDCDFLTNKKPTEENIGELHEAFLKKKADKTEKDTKEKGSE